MLFLLMLSQQCFVAVVNAHTYDVSVNPLFLRYCWYLSHWYYWWSNNKKFKILQFLFFTFLSKILSYFPSFFCCCIAVELLLHHCCSKRSQKTFFFFFEKLGFECGNTIEHNFGAKTYVRTTHVLKTFVRIMIFFRY